MKFKYEFVKSIATLSDRNQKNDKHEIYKITLV